MNTEVSLEVAVLIAVSKGEPINNSNKLMQMIERRFQYVRSDLILSNLRENHYVDYELVNGVYYYKLTDKGGVFIEENFKESQRFLEVTNPNEASFIESLFALWPINDQGSEKGH